MLEVADILDGCEGYPELTIESQVYENVYSTLSLDTCRKYTAQIAILVQQVILDFMEHGQSC